MGKNKVFHDPTHRRSKVVTFGIVLALTLSLGVFLIFAYSIFQAPTLNTKLQTQSNTQSVNEDTYTSLLPRNVQKSSYVRLRSKLYEKIRQSPKSTPGLRIHDTNSVLSSAFVLGEDRKSVENLRMYIQHLDVIFPDFLKLDKENLTRPIYQDTPTVTQTAMDAKVKIIPFLNNYFDDAWQPKALSSILRSSGKRHDLSVNLATILKEHNADGINIDFEGVLPSDQPYLRLFMSELQREFHTRGLIVTQDIPFTDDNFDLHAYGEVNDYVLVMMYDEHSGSDSPGPIASLPWTKDNLDRVFSLVPKEKVIAGVGSYGREWDENGKIVSDLSYGEVMQEMKENKASVSFDKTALNPTFQFTTPQGKKHQIWFLDAVTVFDQLQEIAKHEPAGYALWRLGEEDRSLWTFFGDPLSQITNIDKRLKELPEPKTIDFEGAGDILSVSQESSPGKRSVVLQNGTITNETYDQTPLPFVIQKIGFKPKKVVLTFDDGPDETYTPKILDILRQKKAPAVFFLMGQNAEKNLPLVKQIYDDGHEIGDHTFTHPNITLVSPEQLKLELTTTQRLIESQLYVKTILFRAPYDVDTDPETRIQVVPLSYARELGYITVGASIDSLDWQRPGAQAIIDNVMNNVGSGGVILLHDAGGDRSQTIEALPTLIDSLRVKGFTITTIADLMDKKKSDIMPPIGVAGKVVSFFNDRVFSFVFFMRKVIYYSFFLIIGMSIFRLVFLGTLSFIYSLRKKELTNEEIGKSDFLVSILVPAHNEAQVIQKTLASLLQSVHKRIEIIVIDDGSTDATSDVVASIAKKDARVQLLTRQNEGKTASLNAGLLASKGEIIVTIDADTIFSAHTLSELVKHFRNNEVGAVAGNVVVGNLVNILSYWQAVEYVTSQNFDRRAFDVLNCITVVPGATGAFRRQAIEEIGEFSDDTWAEDSDLTIQIIRNGWKVLYEDRAIARTEAPETVGGFLKQRLRWSLGTIQNVYKHKKALFNPKYGFLGMFALPNLLIFGLIIPLLSPLLDLQFVLLLLGGALGSAAVYYLIFIALDMSIGIVAFSFAKQPKWMLIFIPIQRLVYRQLMYYALIKAVWTALRGTDTKWNKLQRTGNVS